MKKLSDNGCGGCCSPLLADGLPLHKRPWAWNPTHPNDILAGFERAWFVNPDLYVARRAPTSRGSCCGWWSRRLCLAVGLFYSDQGVPRMRVIAGERPIIPIPTTRVRSAHFRRLTTGRCRGLSGLGEHARASRWPWASVEDRAQPFWMILGRTAGAWHPRGLFYHRMYAWCGNTAMIRRWQTVSGGPMYSYDKGL